MVHGWKDFTRGVSIEAVAVATLPIDIKAQSIGNVNVNLAASAVTINVDVKTDVLPVGQAKPAVGLDGVGDGITVAHHANLTPTSEDFTIVRKLRFRSIANSPQIWAKGLIPGDGVAVQVMSSGLIRVYTAQAASWQTTDSSAGDIGLNTDYIIHIVRSGASIKIYVNGVDKTAAPGTHTDPVTNNRTLYLDQNGFGLCFINGIDYLTRFYWQRALNPAEVTEDAARPEQPIQAGLEMWLNLEEGTGSSLADKTGNGHTGTLTGGTWVSQKGGASSAITVNIAAQSLGNLAVDIKAQTIGNINVNIAAQSSNVNVNLSAQSIDITILAPSGKMVSLGASVANGALYTATAIAASAETTIITVSGRGKLSFIGFQIWGDATTRDMDDDALRVYIDGTKKFDLWFEDIDQWGNGGAVSMKKAAVSTVYYPDTVNPRMALTMIQTASDHLANYQRCGGFVNIEFEYTTSFSIRINAGANGAGTVGMIIMYGPYV